MRCHHRARRGPVPPGSPGTRGPPLDQDGTEWSAGIGPRSRSRGWSVRAVRREPSPIDAQALACRDYRWPPCPSVQHLEGKRVGSRGAAWSSCSSSAAHRPSDTTDAPWRAHDAKWMRRGKHLSRPQLRSPTLLAFSANRTASSILPSTSATGLLVDEFLLCPNTRHNVRNTDNGFMPWLALRSIRTQARGRCCSRRATSSRVFRRLVFEPALDSIEGL